MTVSSEVASTQEPDSPAPPVHGRLNQPRRALVAAAEVVVAALLVWLALWLWPKASVTIVQEIGADRPPLVSHRYLGNWLALSVLSGSVAALFLLDAVRQSMLAVSTGRHRAS